jgi:hypothetical protein
MMVEHPGEVDQYTAEVSGQSSITSSQVAVAQAFMRCLTMHCLVVTVWSQPPAGQRSAVHKG